MHSSAFAFVQKAKVQLKPKASDKVVEIGSRVINGSIKRLFDNVSSYVGIDIIDGPGVDVVASGSDYKPDELVDFVVCCEVLEHVDDDTAKAIIKNSLKMLQDGGYIILTAAGSGRLPHSAYDGAGLRSEEFYRNVSVDNIMDWVGKSHAKILTIEENERDNDIYAIIQKGQAETK